MTSATRILVTGSGGFVAPYLKLALLDRFRDVVVRWTSRREAIHPVLGKVLALDVLDDKAVAEAVRTYAPSHIFHMAAIGAPAAATRDPQRAWDVHVRGTLNVARAILEHSPKCVLLFVGSGMVYGESSKGDFPLDESSLLAPTDEYSVTKAAADLAVGALAHQGLACVRLRPFNHTGVGQSNAFAIPAFASQIARIEAGSQPPRMQVGNLEAERDFLDVRDVADAYALVAQRSSEIPSGTIFNIASGKPIRMRDVLDQLLALSHTQIAIETVSTRLRSQELPRLVGQATRITERLGWTPVHDFNRTIATMLNYFRTQVGLSNFER